MQETSNRGPESEESPQSGRSRKKLAILSFLTLFLLIFGLLAAGVYWYGSKILSASGLSWNQAKNDLTYAWDRRHDVASRRTNFLILGLDQRDDRLEQTLLTDTIIFASLDPADAELTLMPIPRDLWIDPLKTKVNALYYYGELDEKTTGPALLSDLVATITGQPVHHWILMDYRKLGDLVDLVGGVTVELDQGFVDNEFPNPDYVEGEATESSKFITVNFDQGANFLDGERALQFVRSRHSEDLKEGTDLSRSTRQMKLFRALTDKIISPGLLSKPKKVGKLYQFWSDYIETDLSDKELLTLGFALAPQKALHFSMVSIPADYNGADTILNNPPQDKYTQCV